MGRKPQHDKSLGRGSGPAAVRRWIRTAGLSPGDALPTEHALAAALGSSQPTVHRALVELERTGELERRGRTRRVARVPPAHSTPGDVLMRDSVLLLGRSLGGPARGSGTWDAVAAACAAELAARGVSHLAVTPFGETHLETFAAAGGRVVALQAADIEAAPLAALLGRLRALALTVAAYGEPRHLRGCRCVRSDHAGGSAALVRHLAARGFHRLLPVQEVFAPGAAPAPFFAERLRGHRAACRELGLPVFDPVVVEQLPLDRPPQATFELNRRLLAGHLAEALRRERPDVLLAPSDGNVPAIAAACRILGHDPARQPRIAGYDHFWELVLERRYEATPPVATVDKDNPAIGRRLARLAAALVAGRTTRGATVPQVVVAVG